MKINLQEWESRIEPHVIGAADQVQQHIKPKGGVLDIGANTGLFGRIVANRNPDCTVVCFEPVQRYYDYMVSKAPLNVRCIRTALGSGTSQGSVDLHCASENLGWNTLVTEKCDDDNAGHIETVPIAALDSFEDINPSFIKIDVEGYESQVLIGGMDTIKRNMPVMLVEIGWGPNNPLWDDELAVFEELFEMGYQRFDPWKVTSTQDVLFIPER